MLDSENPRTGPYNAGWSRFESVTVHHAKEQFNWLSRSYPDANTRSRCDDVDHLRLSTESRWVSEPAASELTFDSPGDGHKAKGALLAPV